MEPLQFAYWLQGFAELNDQPPTPEQWQSIREHLATVFEKVTPAVSLPSHTFIPSFAVKGPEFGNKPELITQCGSDLNRPVATWVNQQIPQPSHFFTQTDHSDLNKYPYK